ncbi:uncharacterized protein HD556DRAFT_271389 [Suillus plorans]|uniref:Secreted protein n=1 Tax=Suillus plorans TaxID=116603 RepID=A0A9P7DKK2_9AGAM|nr:uncharacterized protein HD556DRAFT_271389 [Suillus plorans]KAG1797076.1 hypothetical protein HD556DRAFT_271389 [Suillus plorans]
MVWGLCLLFETSVGCLLVYSLQRESFFSFDTQRSRAGFSRRTRANARLPRDVDTSKHASPSTRSETQCRMRNTTKHVRRNRISTKCSSAHLCRFVEVQIPHTGEIHCLPRGITFSFSSAYSSWTVNRKQSPLRSAYATTFDVSAGLTLEKASLDLHTESFAHGQ